MSWQTYVDEHLMCDIDGTGHHLTAAAIVGHDGSVWAQSSSFPQVSLLYIFSSACRHQRMSRFILLCEFRKPVLTFPDGLLVLLIKFGYAG